MYGAHRRLGSLFAIAILFLVNTGCMRETLDQEDRALLQDTERFNAKKGLTGWSVNRAIIDSMDLTGLHLKGSYVENVGWAEMTVTDGTIRNTTFEDVDFKNSTFVDTKFANVRFIDCTFQRSVFDGGRFENVRFDGGKGTKVEFIGLTLEDSGFYGFVDGGGLFKKIEFDSTRLEKVEFTGTDFYDVQMREGTAIAESHLKDVYFSEPHFEEGRFTECQLEEVGFGKATGRVRFRRCESEQGFTVVPTRREAKFQLRFEDCGPMQGVRLVDAAFDSVQVEGCEDLYDISLYNGSIDELEVVESNIEYFNIENATIQGAIRDSEVRGMVFMDSKIEDFTISNSRLRDFMHVNNTQFRGLRLENVTYTTPFEVRGQESASYENSDTFETR